MSNNPRSFVKGRPLVCASICFIAGIMLGRRFSALPIYIALAALFAAGAFCLRRARRSVLPALLALAFILGALRVSLFLSAMPTVAAGQYSVSAVVDTDTEPNSSGNRKAYLRDVTITDEGGEKSVNGRVYWSFMPAGELPESLYAGQRVVFSGRVYYPSGADNPGSFDFGEYLLGEGAYLAIYGAKNLAVTDGGFSVRDVPDILKRELIGVIERMLGKSAPLAQSMLLGEKDELDASTRAAFSGLGISHMLAVSGLHVSLFTLAITRLLMLFGLRRRTAYFAVMPLMLLYASLTGFSASCLRAIIIAAFMMGGFIFHKPQDSLTSLAASAVFVLVFSPMQLYSAGFVLSYSAVIGIILMKDAIGKPIDLRLARRIRTGRGNPRALKLARRGVSALSFLISAQLGTLIPSIVYFGRVSLISIVTNCFLVFPLEGLMLLFLFCIPCAIFPFLSFVGSAVGALAAFTESMIQTIGALPALTLRLPMLPPVFLLLSPVIIFLISDYCLIRKRLKLAVSAFSHSVLIVAVLLLMPRGVSYTFLSCGQEDAAVIIDENRTIVVDTATDGFAVEDYLEYTGRTIDTLIITHLHSDHAGGLERLLDDNMPIGELLLPVGAESADIDEGMAELVRRAKDAGIPVGYVSAGDVIAGNKTVLTVLYPIGGADETGANPNDFSMALRLDACGSSMLLMGDLTSKAEMHCVSDVNALKIAHHGSADSTSAEFLCATSPEFGLVSARDGGFLPSKKTLARLTEAGVKVYATNECGAITVRFMENGLNVSTYLAAE
ncbi:MAG: ComEC/Rec2 family competence protein [Eubacteriales bacterium]|nr:ComEC/Rec2 family competence protein [Eubacteriales bacterium]MDD3881270.1 ComEC/Rec2 family competence protein [Eubacteriales bacterium]MDD4512188.1 ComEC/Rec2 family competence protein [Eubacteriales bacterium]